MPTPDDDSAVIPEALKRILADFKTRPGYEQDQILIKNTIELLHKQANALLKYKAFPAVEIDDALRNCGGLVGVFDSTADLLTSTADFIKFIGERLNAESMLADWDTAANKLSAQMRQGRHHQN